jgi:hypothetical protein
MKILYIPRPDIHPKEEIAALPSSFTSLVGWVTELEGHVVISSFYDDHL